MISCPYWNANGLCTAYKLHPPLPPVVFVLEVHSTRIRPLTPTTPRSRGTRKPVVKESGGRTGPDRTGLGVEYGRVLGRGAERFRNNVNDRGGGQVRLG